MNCSTCRQWLAAPDDAPASRPELDAHLAECAACRAYEAEADSLRRLLDCVPDPEVRIDPRAVLAGSVARSDRGRRRWRAAAVLAMAASLLLAAWAATHIELELRAGALTVAWGPRPAATPPAPLAAPSAEVARLNEIAGLLAAELEDQDARHRRDLALLVGQVRQLQSAQRADIAGLERDFRALYAATQTSFTPVSGGQP